MEDFKNISHTEGRWFTFPIGGGDNIKLKIRPLTPEIYFSITNHNINKKKKVKSSNWKTLSDDVVGYIFEDFKGIGDEEMRLLENNLKNKRTILSLPLYCGKKSILDFVVEKACELGGIKYNVPI